MGGDGGASGGESDGTSDEMGTGEWEKLSVKMTLRSASVKTEHRESTFVLRPMTGAVTEAAGPRAPRLREAGESPDKRVSEDGDRRKNAWRATENGKTLAARLDYTECPSSSCFICLQHQTETSFKEYLLGSAQYRAPTGS